MGLGDKFRDKAEDAVEKVSGTDQQAEPKAHDEDRGGPSEAAKNAKNDWDIAKND